MYTFNELEWKEKIQDPLWYLEVPAVMKQLMELKSKDESTFNVVREQIYQFFETELAQGTVVFGQEIKNFDAERKEIDTVVIHHTHGEIAMTKERLSAIELLRLYAVYFANPTYEQDLIIKGKGLFSGHVRSGKQVFYPYHFFINADGTVEELLRDEEVGWHSGNWEVNCRSIAVALNANYENGTPSQIEIEAIAKLIREKYPYIKKENIVGHREINPKTTCPSNLFLSLGVQRGWKEDLLALL